MTQRGGRSAGSVPDSCYYAGNELSARNSQIHEGTEQIQHAVMGRHILK
jgi:alkylation response protein AidB-like acyl-CoA dehydrogenase